MIDEAKLNKSNTLNNSDLISLMGIYLSEWQHRDELLWTQVFRYFYASLIVTILPNIAVFIGIKLPEINIKLFPIMGMVMACVFLYVGAGYAVRLMASSRTYEKMMNLLGNEDYKRVSIKDRSEIKWGHLFAAPMAIVLVVTMFIALEIVAILLLVV